MKLTQLDRDIFREFIYHEKVHQAVIKKIESIDPIELLTNKLNEYELGDESNPYLIDMTGFFIGDDSNPEAKFDEVLFEYIIYSIFTNRYCSKVRSAYTLESAETIPIEIGKRKSSMSKHTYTSANGGKFIVHSGRFGFKLELDPTTLPVLLDDISNVQSIAGYILEELKVNLLKHWLKISRGEAYIFHYKASLNYNQKMLELILGLDSTTHRDLSLLTENELSMELNRVVNEILDS